MATYLALPGDDTPLNEAVRLCVAAGFAPLPVHGKRPFEPGWNTLATLDPELVRARFIGHRGNVGVHTGFNRLIVIDADGEKGVADLQRLADMAGLQEMPPTLTAISGSGRGQHLFYLLQDGQVLAGRNLRKIGLDIDVKGTGGQVVCAPSVHECGGKYRFIPPTLAPLELVRSLYDVLYVPDAPAFTVVRTEAPVGEDLEYLYDELDKYPESIEFHGGNGPFFAAMCQVAAEYKVGRITQLQASEAIAHYNRTKCKRPWDAKDIAHAWKNAQNNGKKRPLPREDRPMTNGHVRPTAGEGIMGVVSAEELAASRALRGRVLYLHDRWGRATTHLLPGSHNQITLLRYDSAWIGKIRLNEFAMEVEITDPPWVDIRAPGTHFLANEDGNLLSQWYQHAWDLSVSPNQAHETLVVVAKANRYNPVRDWMDSLVWDGVPRLNTWLSKYLGAEQSEYTALVGRWWLISAVARTYVPGCKVDHMLQLEGVSQGEGKSTALSTLAGAEWFSDTPFDLNKTQESGQAIAGVLIYEFGEMSSMGRADVGRIKNFCSSRNDKFRVPWGKVAEPHPRRCVFAATTNHDQSFRDETGNRRFWPVKTGKHSLKELAQDREQLWAEAVAAYQAGERWWPAEDSERALMSEQQDARVIRDAWEPRIQDWIEREGLDVVDMPRLLKEAVQIEVGHWTEKDQQRVGRVMRLIGWEKFRERDGKSLRWAYRKALT